MWEYIESSYDHVQVCLFVANDCVSCKFNVRIDWIKLRSCLSLNVSNDCVSSKFNYKNRLNQVLIMFQIDTMQQRQSIVASAGTHKRSADARSVSRGEYCW